MPFSLFGGLGAYFGGEFAMVLLIWERKKVREMNKSVGWEEDFEECKCPKTDSMMQLNIYNQNGIFCYIGNKE